MPYGGRVDKTSTTEIINLGSTPGRDKPKSIKINITVSLLAFQP